MSVNSKQPQTQLSSIDLTGNGLTSLTLPEGLNNLTTLGLYGNQLTNVSFLAGRTSLTELDLSFNQLTALTLRAGLTNLTTLSVSGKKLTSLAPPMGLTSLANLNLGDNQLTNFSFLSELTRLRTLNLDGNKLTILTLPPGLTTLNDLLLGGNPLTTFVLPEPLADTGYLAFVVVALKTQGVSVYTYPLGGRLSLASPQRTPAGTFGFALTGPPAVYTVFSSPDLVAWSQLETLTNTLGVAIFTDVAATNSSRKFYRAVSP